MRNYIGTCAVKRELRKSSYLAVYKCHYFIISDTITALFKTNFRPDFPFDTEEFIAFSLIGWVPVPVHNILVLKGVILSSRLLT